VLVCSGGTTDGTLKSAGSADTSVGASWAEVLIEEGTVLAVSRFLVKRGMIPHESVTLDEEEKMVLSSGALVAT